MASHPDRVMPLERLKWLPVPLAALFYVMFIARTRREFEGRSFFALADDAMISMTYARNLAEGEGLVWGDGNEVEGYSNFLWTLWMAVLHLLPVSELKLSLLVMISSALILLLNVVVIGRICAELAPSRPALEAAAMLLTGLYYPLTFWALRGMEVGVVALLISLLALLGLRLSKRFERRWVWALAATVAAALLTRDELIVPCVLTVAFLMWAGPRESRRTLASYVGGTIVLVFITHLLFRVAYYGEALPNTYYLKLAEVPLDVRLKRGIEGVAYTWLVTLYAPLLMAVAYFVARGRSAARGALLLATLFVAESVYSMYVGGDYEEDLRYANRYIAAVVPLLMIVAALGIGEILDGGRRRSLRLAVTAAFLLTAGLVALDWLPTGWLFEDDMESGLDLPRAGVAVAIAAAVAVTPLVGRFSARRAGIRYAVGALALASLLILQVDRVPAGDWVHYSARGLVREAGYARYGLILGEHTAPATAVASGAVGNVAYFSKRPVVDLLGKMDPVIAKGKNRPKHDFRPGHSKWNYHHSVGRLRPEVVAEIFRATPRDLCDLARWGYRQIAPGFYVHTGARGIDIATISRKVDLTNFKPWQPPPRGCA